MITTTPTHLILPVLVAKALLTFSPKKAQYGIGIDAGSVCATDGYSSVRFVVNPPISAEHNETLFDKAVIETAMKVAVARKEPVLSIPWQDNSDFPALHVLEASLEGMPVAAVVPIDATLFKRVEAVCKACGTLKAEFRVLGNALSISVRGEEISAGVVVMPLQGVSE